MGLSYNIGRGLSAAARSQLVAGPALRDWPCRSITCGSLPDCQPRSRCFLPETRRAAHVIFGTESIYDHAAHPAQAARVMVALWGYGITLNQSS